MNIRNKNVLLTSQSSQLGGMERRITDEAQALKEMGHEPHIAINSFPEYGPMKLTCAQSNIPFQFFSPPDFIQHWRWRHLRKVTSLCVASLFWRSERPDLCHVFLPWTDQGLSRVWLASRFQIPTVLSIHNTFPMGEFAPWQERHIREAFRSLRGGYAVSRSALLAFEAIFGRYFPNAIDLRVIHNFVDTERFVPSPDKRKSTRKELDIPQGALVMGSVGRLADQKRPESIVRLFARLRARFPDLYLILAGQGPLEASVRRLADSLGVTPYVRLTGFIEKTEEIYPALDLHVLLSRNEGFGISTIEAMSCGVSVIGTDVPGTRDVLRDLPAHTLVPLDDESATVEAASLMLGSEELRRSLATDGRSLAIRRYSKAKWLEEISEFYDETLSKICGQPCA